MSLLPPCHRRYAIAAALLVTVLRVHAYRIETAHDIEPIHITIDINLKIDRELDDFFDDVDAVAAAPTPATEGVAP